VSHWAEVSGAQVTWDALLVAVERYVATCSAGDLCEWDAGRLRAAARAVTLRVEGVLEGVRGREGGAGAGETP
jgi:hypothetical protein